MASSVRSARALARARPTVSSRSLESVAASDAPCARAVIGSRIADATMTMASRAKLSKMAR
jgi:hypothetical protein